MPHSLQKILWYKHKLDTGYVFFFYLIHIVEPHSAMAHYQGKLSN